MALQEYMGGVILDVNGREFDCTNVKVNTEAGRKVVKAMNRRRRISGFARTIVTYSLSIEVVVPKEGDIAWEDVEGAKLTITPDDDVGTRVSYLDCFTLTVGETYQVENEMVRTIEMGAVTRIEE